MIRLAQCHYGEHGEFKGTARAVADSSKSLTNLTSSFLEVRKETCHVVCFVEQKSTQVGGNPGGDRFEVSP